MSDHGSATVLHSKPWYKFHWPAILMVLTVTLVLSTVVYRNRRAEFLGVGGGSQYGFSQNRSATYTYVDTRVSYGYPAECYSEVRHTVSAISSSGRLLEPSTVKRTWMLEGLCINVMVWGGMLIVAGGVTEWLYRRWISRRNQLRLQIPNDDADGLPATADWDEAKNR